MRHILTLDIIADTVIDVMRVDRRNFMKSQKTKYTEARRVFVWVSSPYYRIGEIAEYLGREHGTISRMNQFLPHLGFEVRRVQRELDRIIGETLKMEHRIELAQD